ncbi:hypothetical protein TKK_0009144 [Trichogramma kaykai]|uniref:BTB domain-containing protein n=1 Tax=Trichogramma kaykai TaxID=54128 RepID=A0ABD2X3H7_9HYME
MTTTKDGSVGELQQTELSYKQKWIVKNFSEVDYACRSGASHKIVSPHFFTSNDYVDLEWRLSLYPRGKPAASPVVTGTSTGNRCMSLYVESLNDICLTATVSLSFLNCNNERIAEKTLLNKQFGPRQSYGYRQFIDRKYVLVECNSVLPNDSLTVHCEIVLDASLCSNDDSSTDRNDGSSSSSSTDDDDDDDGDDNDPGEIDELKRRLRELGDYEKLFESGDFSDVIFSTRDGAKIPAHRCVLASRSPVFKAMFSRASSCRGSNGLGKLEHQQQGVVEVKDVGHKVLKELLRFAYTGRLLTDQQNSGSSSHKSSSDCDEISADLLVAAEKYSLQGLKDLCEKRLMSRLSTKNAVEYLKLADTYGADRLKKRTIEFVAAHSDEIVHTQDFQLLGDLHRSVICELFRATVAQKTTSTKQ